MKSLATISNTSIAEKVSIASSNHNMSHVKSLQSLDDALAESGLVDSKESADKLKQEQIKLLFQKIDIPQADNDGSTTKILLKKNKSSLLSAQLKGPVYENPFSAEFSYFVRIVFNIKNYFVLTLCLLFFD